MIKEKLFAEMDTNQNMDEIFTENEIIEGIELRWRRTPSQEILIVL